MLVVMVDVRIVCLHVGLPVCLSLGWVVLAMVPPPVHIDAKSTMMSLGIKMWMHMMMNMKIKIMVAMGTNPRMKMKMTM